MKAVVLLGRFFYSLIFLLSTAIHFSPQAVNIAASAGVPAADYLVPLSGLLAVAGAISIMVGFKARIGAWCIIVILVPMTFIMYPFWQETEIFQMELQAAMFLKNVSLIGAAMMISYFGAGPLSFDADDRKFVKSSVGRPEFLREHLKKYV